mgnify:CR=1 FL=1
MKVNWDDRNPIVANLFNPAFCGQIIRIVVQSYNQNSNKKFPFALVFIILPILLHKETRERMPKSIRTYFLVWIEENGYLFINFSSRAKSMVKYTKEALIFTLMYKEIEINEFGEIITENKKTKKINNEDYQEYNEIYKKAEMLGKWLAQTSDVKSIYSFLRITP